jgi:hypothetical protein
MKKQHDPEARYCWQAQCEMGCDRAHDDHTICGKCMLCGEGHGAIAHHGFNA